MVEKQWNVFREENDHIQTTNLNSLTDYGNYLPEKNI